MESLLNERTKEEITKKWNVWIKVSDNFKVTIVGNLSSMKDQNIKFTIHGFNQSSKELFY